MARPSAPPYLEDEQPLWTYHQDTHHAQQHQDLRHRSAEEEFQGRNAPGRW